MSQRDQAFRVATPSQLPDLPTYDFAGRRLRLVKSEATFDEEPSPLVDAILRYLARAGSLP